MSPQIYMMITALEKKHLVILEKWPIQVSVLHSTFCMYIKASLL